MMQNGRIRGRASGGVEVVVGEGEDSRRPGGRPYPPTSSSTARRSGGTRSACGRRTSVGEGDRVGKLGRPAGMGRGPGGRGFSFLLLLFCVFLLFILSCFILFAFYFSNIYT